MATDSVSKPRSSDNADAPRPSASLLTAAIMGLVGFSLPACDDDSQQEPDPMCPPGGTGQADDGHAHDEHGDDNGETTGSPNDGGTAADDDGSTTGTGEDSESDGSAEDSGGSESGDTGEPEVCDPPPEITSEARVDQTFAQYTADCDALGGYIQIHAACAGVNSCAGFSIGDWDPDIRSDHTCRGLNGCNGLSCIFTPPDGGRTGAEVLRVEAVPNGQPDDVPNGPALCSNCHSVYDEEGVLDETRFKLWVMPGSGRDETNWLDRSAAVQERIVAFGAHGITEDGIAYASMAAYGKSFSRAEIQRAVEHIRTLTPDVHVIKLTD